MISALLLSSIFAPLPAAGVEGMGDVFGKVEDLTGEPVAGAAVTLRHDRVRKAVTDEAGSFRFLQVEPGIHLLFAAAGTEYSIERRALLVRAGRSTSLEVSLRSTKSKPPAGKIELEKIELRRERRPIPQLPGVVVERVNVGGNDPGCSQALLRIETHDLELDFNGLPLAVSLRVLDRFDVQVDFAAKRVFYYERVTEGFVPCAPCPPASASASYPLDPIDFWPPELPGDLSGTVITLCSGLARFALEFTEDVARTNR